MGYRTLGRILHHKLIHTLKKPITWTKVGDKIVIDYYKKPEILNPLGVRIIEKLYPDGSIFIKEGYDNEYSFHTPFRFSKVSN